MRISSRQVHSAVAAALLAAAPVGYAQTVISSSEGFCAGCAIEAQVIWRLSGRDEQMVGPFAVMARDSRGRWLLSTNERATSITVFDSAGTRLSSFSRPGQGPGEFASVDFLIVSRGDTVHLFDNALRRRSVFSPSYEFVRATPYPGVVRGAVELPNGWLIVNADFPTPQRVGYPLHRLHPTGAIGPSFGIGVPGYRVDAAHLIRRFLTATHDNHVWTIPSQRYELELWAPDRRLREAHRKVEWFPPVQGVSPPGLMQPPTPSVQGTWFDKDERLWVMLRVPDARWSPQPGARSSHIGRSTKPVIYWDREYDTIIELIDTRTGRLLASRRFDEAMSQLLPGGRVQRYVEDADGEPSVEIWQLAFITLNRRNE